MSLEVGLAQLRHLYSHLAAGRPADLGLLGGAIRQLEHYQRERDRMPVSPKDAKAHVTADEQTALDAIIAKVDEQLPLVFQGGEVTIKHGIGLTARMVPRLVAAYETAGWKFVGVDAKKCEITLGEYARCSGSEDAWGR